MNKSTVKKRFGQYFTTNSHYVLSNLIGDMPQEATIVDPFCGDSDLLKLFPHHHTIGLDINPQNSNIKKNNSFREFDYENKWVVSNPPYLARNKNKTKNLYDDYKTDDYYKIFFLTLLKSKPCGGIAIVPTNFFCSDSKRIITSFISEFEITRLNMFEEPVFEDTSQSVCSFSFRRKPNNICQSLEVNFFPQKKSITTTIEKKHSYIIGNEFFDYIDHDNPVKIGRLEKDKFPWAPNTKMFLSALDTSKSLELRLDDYYYGIKTDRAFATIVLPFWLSYKDQQFVCDEFNKIINYYREEYNSMFLTTYREAKGGKIRKRISFRNAYKLISKIIIDNHLKKP